MIKVLQIGFSSNPGGVENLVMNYYKHINKSQFQFDFLDIYADGIAYENEIKTLGGNVLLTPNYKKHPLSFLSQFEKILYSNRYDIVHIHMQSAANILPFLVVKKYPQSVFIGHCHSSSTPQGFLRKACNSINVHFLRSINIEKWACGIKAGNWMWGKYFDQNNILPNAIDYKYYMYNTKIREKIRGKLGIKKEEKVIGFVGRFGDEKNTFFLLDILKELKKIDCNYRLLTVGGNDLYENFLDRARNENLMDSIVNVGIKESARDYYQAMDSFLLPSFFEGFPMVCVEAQAAGLPCFLSDRISNEVNITNSVAFLPLGINNARTWASAIDNTISERTDRNISFPKNYDINYAVHILEKSYLNAIKTNEAISEK